MTATGALQVFDALPPAIEDALRASIERFGVLVPVVKDQHGRIVDGNNRSRIADKLGVTYRVDVVQVADDAEAREVARTLNADRRQLTEDQRRQVVAVLASATVAAGKGGREEVARHSPNAIAGALGVSLDTVQRDVRALTDAGKLTRPEKTLGLDNKVRLTRRPTEPDPEPASEAASEPNPEAEPAPIEGEKARRKSPNRKPLGETARSTGWELNKVVERVVRIAADDRYAANAQQVATHLRHHLLRSIEALSEVLNQLPETKENGTS